jgi:hypothetical protein
MPHFVGVFRAWKALCFVLLLEQVVGVWVQHELKATSKPGLKSKGSRDND